MKLQSVVGLLYQYASPKLAGDWDNVGLLVEPTDPHEVTKLFLTNDLTPPVLDEAIDEKANMILSYHPPLFSPVKRLTQASWKDRVITKCIENRIAVFSPHTSHDALDGGVNDWLISVFDLRDKSPIEPTVMPNKKFSKKRIFTVPVNLAPKLIEGLSNIKGTVTTSIAVDPDLVQISFLGNQENAPDVMAVISEHMKVIKSIESYDLQKVVWPGYGMGRKGTLKQPLSLEDAVSLVKKHTNLDHVRLAAAQGESLVSSVAVCAGSGSSVLRNVPVSLYVTGEMSHHEVLHAVHSGTSVILCDHSNTERGYLSVLKQELNKLFKGKIDIVISSQDRDPLEIV
ncbi:NIF3-like protein 1 isoform X2 [Mizuhopecten yessoensis]|uniref:NIF3-like protein 1 n=2 Tax=Mizuhopecten yessoensis TaxID=6573 RepID=A0A210R6K6_MIZYE|nr:NIF3-like protein 1 isoform X2 [Mizuhopecten yessoensis]XP_021345468.1 NIF3-like protein 1 isoform X2 [Mizuhopecten yessoensis]XP_021345476.1 NIF3-like protein 1 isoform X2 [Mizuhopecten yessoensis]OWF56642.1 NIF3-like protein 1 [Mizuhopecten yessoensis]